MGEGEIRTGWVGGTVKSGRGHTPAMGVMLPAKYEECIERRLYGEWIEVRCKLGLWCISGLNAEEVEREARHYWAQYYIDGEYDQLLGKV